MSSATGELLRRAVAAVRRSALWWGVGIAALTFVSVAFWPSLEGTDSLTEMMETSPELMEAFGVQDLATPAGYLDGQLFALMLPLLLSGLAIAVISALTSGDEDAGRLELLHALPIGRVTIWLTRFAGGAAAVVLVSLVTAVLVCVSLAPFSLDGIGIGRVLAATGGCALLALFHGAVAYAAGGLGTSRGIAVGAAVATLVLGYVLDYLVPLSDSLADLQKASPWYWAIGEQPVTDGIDPVWLVPLLATLGALVLLGTVGVNRRDIRAA